MCWACEEDALWRRYQLEMAVERGEKFPPGFEPEDFEAAGLPVPQKRAASVKPANPFTCDSPDGA